MYNCTLSSCFSGPQICLPILYWGFLCWLSLPLISSLGMFDCLCLLIFLSNHTFSFQVLAFCSVVLRFSVGIMSGSLAWCSVLFHLVPFRLVLVLLCSLVFLQFQVHCNPCISLVSLLCLCVLSRSCLAFSTPLLYIIGMSLVSLILCTLSIAILYLLLACHLCLLVSNFLCHSFSCFPLAPHA